LPGLRWHILLVLIVLSILCPVKENPKNENGICPKSKRKFLKKQKMNCGFFLEERKKTREKSSFYF
jgi:hypothetical protein